MLSGIKDKVVQHLEWKAIPHLQRADDLVSLLCPRLLHSESAAKLKRINKSEGNIDLFLLLFLYGNSHLHLHLWVCQGKGGLPQERLYEHS